ncbi:SCP2 domain-containing protein [Kistimonas scapharcae]|uniref:Ubiquinone biosynthesis accessory factor UbiJ n=1 Tax=Kistimonas scapharcae TaxID=1036133 RepID=A0ABP8UZC4_9GAMM
MTSLLETMPGTAARMALEKGLKQVLKLDPVTARRFAELKGQVLQVAATSPVVDIWLVFTEEGIELRACHESEVDCVIRGTAPALARLAVSDEPMATLFNEGITLTGNSDLLLTVSTIVKHSEFDWEALLARYSGGIAAHAVGQVSRVSAALFGDMAATARLNLSEYLQEELRVLPPKNEVSAFRDDLDTLRLAADRLQARVDRLTAKTQQQTQDA